jgi:hypothetical protein
LPYLAAVLVSAIAALPLPARCVGRMEMVAEQISVAAVDAAGAAPEAAPSRMGVPA